MEVRVLFEGENRSAAERKKKQNKKSSILGREKKRMDTFGEGEAKEEVIRGDKGKRLKPLAPKLAANKLLKCTMTQVSPKLSLFMPH